MIVEIIEQVPNRSFLALKTSLHKINIKDGPKKKDLAWVSKIENVWKIVERILNKVEFLNDSYIERLCLENPATNLEFIEVLLKILEKVPKRKLMKINRLLADCLVMLTQRKHA